MKIIQITDLHLNESASQTQFSDPYAPPIDTEKSFQSVRDTIFHHTPAPSIILITGDIAQEPTDKAYQRISTQLQTLNTDCYCLAGNHDDAIKLKKYLNTNNLHSIDYLDSNNWRLIFLDTSKPEQIGGYLSPKQLSQLKSLLDTKLHILIAMHHPPIPIHSQWMDKFGLQAPDNFLKVINKHANIKGVIFGHIHQAFDETHNAIRFLGSPSTCTQFKSKEDNAIIADLPPAYRELTLKSNGSIKTHVYYVPQQ